MPMQELTDIPQPTATLLPTSTPIPPTATNIPTVIPANVEPLTRNIELIGHIGGEIPGFAVPTPDLYNAHGLATDVIVEGKYAYVVQGADGPMGTEWGRLSVVDISTPSAPSLVGFYTPEVIATNIVVVNKVAYLTDGQCEFGMATCWGNLYILDVSDPTSLAQVGVYGLNNMQSEFPTNRSWFASGVAVSGDYAYVTGGPYHSNSGEECGMSVVDISNAISPTIAGVMRCGDVAWEGQSITLQENYAYIAADDDGLRIIDISNPSGPKEVSHIEGIGKIWDVQVMGSYAYLAADDSGLQIVDITNPSALNLIATFKTAGRALRAYIANGYVYIAASDAGLRVIDISNPNNPTEVAYYDTTGYVYSVSVVNGYIYVADGKEGLLILQFG
ncbi:MAG: hypothetical protein GY832_00455 [Chloroflexi bacterium]|nr:hypothetical protein [Chloroflexota bacterium]